MFRELGLKEADLVLTPCCKEHLAVASAAESRGHRSVWEGCSDTCSLHLKYGKDASFGEGSFLLYFFIFFFHFEAVLVLCIVCASQLGNPGLDQICFMAHSRSIIPFLVWLYNVSLVKLLPNP